MLRPFAWSFKEIREIKIYVYGKREFVPRDQVFPLIVVYCLLFQLTK